MSELFTPLSVSAPSPMELALTAAQMAANQGEVPVGAVIVQANQVLAVAHNQPRSRRDPTAHAEVLAIRMACEKLGNERLEGCDLYVTLEPCTMCAATISYARIRRLYYGATDQKGGAVESGVRFFESKTCHHAPEVYSGLSEEPAAELLKQFFKEKRPTKQP